MSKQDRAEDGWAIIGGDRVRVGVMPRMEWLPRQYPQRQWVTDHVAGGARGDHRASSPTVGISIINGRRWKATLPATK